MKLNMKISTLNIKALFINTLILRIKADYKLNNKTFTQYWGFNNCIYKIENNNVKLKLRLHPPEVYLNTGCKVTFSTPLK